MHQFNHISLGHYNQLGPMRIPNHPEDSYLIKSWKEVYGHPSLQIFYSTKTHSFSAILETYKGFKFIPAARNGFELIKVPLLECSALKNSIASFQHLFSSPAKIVEFFRKEIRYPIIKETSAGYTIQLNGSGLLGGGCEVSKIGFIPESEVQVQVRSVSPEESKQVVKFLSDRYRVTFSKDKNSNDERFIEKLAEKIGRTLSPDQATAANKHLTAFIDVYEEEYMDEVVLEMLGRSLEDGKLQLTDYTNNFCSDKLCIELLRKGYFSRERAKGGLEQEIAERILAKLLEEIQSSGHDYKEKNMNQKQEFRRVFSFLKTRDRLTSILNRVSNLTVKKVLQFIKDKLQLKTENEEEIVDQFCVSSSSNQILDEITNKVLPSILGSGSEESFAIEDGEAPNFQTNPDANNKEEDVFSAENQSFCLSKVRLKVLSELSLLSHDLSSLVELHNLLKADLLSNSNSANNASSMDSALFEVRDTLMTVIKSYKENEANLEAGELKSLLNLAFVQDPKIFRAFLEAFLVDLTSDILFDPQKVRMISLVLISAMRNPNFKDYLQVDDLSKCLKILQPMIEDLSITSDNVNIQEAMSSLNDILFLMGFIGAKGIKGDYLQTVTDLTQYMQTHSLEKIYNIFKSNAKDPSLEIKREYTLEALKRIKTTSFEAWQQNAASIFQAGQIAVQFGRGVFLSDLSSINEALLQIKDLLIQSYIDQPKTWYDNVNELRFLEHEPIDKIIKDLFSITQSYDRNYTFFAAEFLLKVIAQPHRKLLDKKIAAQAAWFLANGYDYRESKIQRVAVASKTYKYDPDIALYIQQSLTTLAQNSDLDFSVYVRKLLEGPLRLDSGSMHRVNLPVSLKQHSPAPADVSQKSGTQDNPGKQFYLNTLSQRKSRLYAIAQIQERCERTLEVPTVLIDFRGVSKEKDFDEAFMRKLEEKVQKISSANAAESILRITSLDVKNTTTTAFYNVLEGIDSQTGTSDQEPTLKSDLLQAVKQKAEEISKASASDLFNAFEKFLTNPYKQVMVIQGDAGTGKTLLLRLCEHRLWKRYHILSKADSKNQNRLPIRIVLSEVKSFNKAIDEFFLEHGCDAEGIQTIKDEPAVIFFDGYDEINQYINLYNLNNLDTWADVKVVFTSRKEHLTSLKEDYLSCFTPGNAKEKVLSYSIQAIDEDQSVKYIAAQMADKKHLIRHLKQTVQSFNYIGSKYMPISNMLLKKIEYLKRLGQGSRYQCLKNTLKAVQEQLPEIKAIQNELSTLETDKLEVLPLVDIAKKQISQFKKLTDKSYIESVLNILELEVLGPIKEAEMSLQTAEEDRKLIEKKKKPLAEDELRVYFMPESTSRRRDERSFGRVLKDFRKKNSTKLPRGMEELCKFIKYEADNFIRMLTMSYPVKASSKHNILPEFRSEITPEIFKDKIEKATKNRQDIRAFIELAKNSYPDVARDYKAILVSAESVASNLIQNLNNFSDFDKLKSLLDQMQDLIDEYKAHGKEISDLNSGDSQFIEKKELLVVKLKAWSLKGEEALGRLQGLQEELRSILPDFSDGGSKASSEKIEFLLSRLKADHKESGDRFNDSCSMIDESKQTLLKTMASAEKLLLSVQEYVTHIARTYYFLQIYEPLTTINERVTQAQKAREELKALKKLQREGSDIVKALDQQATLLMSFDQNKFEPLIQRLNQLSQAIKAYEKEFKSIKDDYTEGSLKVKALNSQIQDLKKFTDPQYLGPIINKFKDLIKSPFILKMLTETLVKFPNVSAYKSELYRLFVSIHFEREKDKLLQTEKIPPRFNILDSFYQYSKDLAVNMYLRNVVSLRAKDYGYKMGRLQAQTENVWQSFFDYEDMITRLARRGAQIVEEDGIVRFVHKSILEYFVARAFYDEVADYDPDNSEDFNPYLNKKPLITNDETSIYKFIQSIYENDANEINRHNYGSTVFEKKIVQILSNFSLYKKYENFEENHLYPNIFLLLLLFRIRLYFMLPSGKENPTFVAIITKMFGWIFSTSEASFSFFETVLQLINTPDGMQSSWTSLVEFYYDIISKQDDGPQFNDRFLTSKRNIHPRIALEVVFFKSQGLHGIEGDRLLSYTLEGKFFIHDSQDSIVVLRSDANNIYFALEDPKGERVIPYGENGTYIAYGTLIETTTPWNVTECKWILRMTGPNQFSLTSLASSHAKVVFGRFENPSDCIPLFGEMCQVDLDFKDTVILPTYKCVTCGLDNLEFCDNCVKHCHKDHNIIKDKKENPEAKKATRSCKCRGYDCCKLVKLCPQRLAKCQRSSEECYKCLECPNDQKNRAVCLTCAKHHHKGQHKFNLAPNSSSCRCNCIARGTQLLARQQTY